jgi:hypothetical protein
VLAFGQMVLQRRSDMKTAIPILLLLLAAASVASGNTCASVPSGTQETSAVRESRDSGRNLIPVWSQLPDLVDGSAYTSSVRLSDGYWAELADDFHCDTSGPVVAIEWWGAHGPPVDLLYVIVRFYEDGSATSRGLPGTMVYEQEIYTFTGEEVTGTTGEDYRYTADLPVPFGPNAGGVYWVSIQGVEQNSQWYWYEAHPDSYWRDEAAFRSEFWGHPDWIPCSEFLSEPRDFAFALYADDTPVEESTWGSIKGLFR